MRHMATKYNHFTRSERNELSILLKKGYSYRSISRAIKKSPSSISREVKDNSVYGRYDPEKAHHKAYLKRRYSKYQGMKIAERNWLESYVKEKLSSIGHQRKLLADWSMNMVTRSSPSNQFTNGWTVSEGNCSATISLQNDINLSRASYQHLFGH